MSLTSLNNLDTRERSAALTRCCGSTAWVEKMASVFPVENVEKLMNHAKEKWFECSAKDWLEAFSHHPKIGDARPISESFPETAKWAAGEQSSVKEASQQVLASLEDGNKVYEKQFGYIFIVCASGKSAEQMLTMLRRRLTNSPDDEIRIAMEEQLKITMLRLRKLIDA